MKALLSPQETADWLGVSLSQVYEWTRRADSPLPSIPVGKTGRMVKIVTAEVPGWLTAEAARKAGQGK